MSKPTKEQISEARQLIPTRSSKQPDPIRVGLGANYGREFHGDPERIARAAALMLDERWPRRFTSWQVHGESSSNEGRRGKLPAGASAEVTKALADGGTVWVELKTRGAHADNVFVDTGKNRSLSRDYACPLRLTASIAVEKMPDPNATVRRWVSLAHDLVSTVGARNGTITIGPSGDVMDDQWSPHLPDPKDHLRILGGGLYRGDAQRGVGGRYSRYPRWGTYLHPEHVAAIGGRDRIAREVEPALLEQVDDLLYIQLTESFDEAHTPAMWEKRLKLRKLMEPILPT
jgi:hypothetical protein